MKLFFGLAIVGFFSLGSCEAILKYSNDIKDPKIENHFTINKYLLKKKIDTATVLIFKDMNSMAAASKKKVLIIPNAMFFNKAGQFISYKKSATDCNAKVDDFIADLDNFDRNHSSDSLNIDTLLNLTNAKKEKINRSAIVVFITWTIYAGKLNDQKAFDWVQLLDEAKRQGIDVNYYLLNCDFQESWNLTKEEKKQLGLR